MNHYGIITWEVGTRGRPKENPKAFHLQEIYLNEIEIKALNKFNVILRKRQLHNEEVFAV